MSATKFESSRTSKENDLKMYKRKLDLQDERSIRLKAPTHFGNINAETHYDEPSAD